MKGHSTDLWRRKTLAPLIRASWHFGNQLDNNKLKMPAFVSTSSLVGLDHELEDFFCQGRLQILSALWRLLTSAVIV